MPNLLVIGASQGIGAAVVRLAAAEVDIYSISRTTPQDLRGKHFCCNVLTDELPKLDIPLHGLLYCPGSINLKPFNNSKLDDFRQDLEVNLLGAVRCLQFYQPQLLAAEAASVVLFSSVAVQTGFPYHSIVSASKGAIEGLTHAVAAEWAPKIRVNAIAPSLTDTPLAHRLLREDSKREAAARRHPLQRIGKAEDIAELALFLLSDRASWITGQVMHADGGVSSLRG